MAAELNNTMLDKTKQLTLEYLTTPYYHNILTSRKKNTLNENKQTDISKEDINFYRKRIVAMTKDLLKGSDIPIPNTNLKTHYEEYVRHMVEYFKMIDRKDIIQEQYKRDENDIENDTSNNDINPLNEIDITNVKLEKADELMMKKTIKIANLDDFITITTNEDQHKQVLPKKKEIDLKCAELKTKGIKKKVSKK